MPADPTTTILRDRFGFARLHPIQKTIIDRVMSGGDALVVMPTGSGKSLCFQLPALALPGPGVALVFSPLIALMEDQVAALKAKGIKAEYINSTLARRERERRMRKLSEGAYELLYATPERMQKPAFVEAIAAAPGGVKLLAVDEAHCISKWGHDLRPAYQEVGRFRTELGAPITVALTATATKRVRDDIRRTLGRTEADMPLFATPVDRPNLELAVEESWDDASKVAQIRTILKTRGRSRGTAIIYFARIKDLEHMHGLLAEALEPRPLEIYHGQLAPREKKAVYERFMAAEPKDGLTLLATNAFGMGVDKPDIRYILHAQLPGSVEAYFQEIGRAGRDGKRSRCVLLYAQDDLAIQHQFIEWQNPSASLLRRTAQAAAESPHADFDLDELHLMVSGKSRQDPRGQLEYVVTALEKRGVIERTSMIGRYRFVRELRDAEVDEAAIARKREHDLRRLLDVVEMTKYEDLAGFIAAYFDLDRDDRKRSGRRGLKTGGARPGAGRGKRGGRGGDQGKDTGAGSGRKKKGRRRGGRRRGASAGAGKREDTGSGAARDMDKHRGTDAPKRRRRRRRGKSTSGAGGAPPVERTDGVAGEVAESGATKKRRRRRRRGRRGRGASRKDGAS